MVIDLKPDKEIIKRVNVLDLGISNIDLYQAAKDLLGHAKLKHTISIGIFEYQISTAYPDIRSHEIVLKYKLVPGQYPEDEESAR